MREGRREVCAGQPHDEMRIITAVSLVRYPPMTPSKGGIKLEPVCILSEPDQPRNTVRTSFFNRLITTSSV